MTGTAAGAVGSRGDLGTSRSEAAGTSGGGGRPEPAVRWKSGRQSAGAREGGDDMERDHTPVPSDDPEVSSEDIPDEQELEISPAEEAELRRQVAFEVENLEQGIQG